MGILFLYFYFNMHTRLQLRQIGLRTFLLFNFLDPCYMSLEAIPIFLEGEWDFLLVNDEVSASQLGVEGVFHT